MPAPADPATFESAKLDWDLVGNSADIHSAYKKLLSLRKDFNLARDDLRELQIEHGKNLSLIHISEPTRPAA